MALENLPFRILEQIDKQSTLPDSVAVDLEKYGIPQKFGKFVADVAEIFKTLQTDDVENETHRLEQLAKVVYTNHKELLNSVFAEKVSIETANLYDSIKQVIKDVGTQYLLKKENAIQKLPNEVSSYVEQQLNIFFVELFHDLDKIFTVDNTNLSNRNNTPNNKKQKNKTSKSKQTEKSKQKPKEEEKQKSSAEQQKSQQPTTKQQVEANNNFISELQHQQEQEEPQAEQIKVVTEQSAKQLVINTLSKHAKPVTEYVKNVLYINTKRILPEKHWFQKKLFRYKHNLKQKFINSTVITNIRKHVTDIKQSHYMLIAKKAFTRIQLSIKNILFKYVRPVLNNIWNRQMQQLFAPIVLVASGTLLLVGGILQAAYSLGRFITKIIISGFKAGIKMLWKSIKYLGGLLKKAFNVVSNLVGNTLNWIIRYPGMFFAGFFFKEICNWIKGNIVGATDLLKNNIITKFLKTTVTKVYDNIKDKYAKFKIKHPKWGKVIDFLLGIGNWSFNFITDIIGWIPNICTWITEIIKPYVESKRNIAEAIKTGNTEKLNEEERKKFERISEKLKVENIEDKTISEILGEIVGDDVANIFSNFSNLLNNIRTNTETAIRNVIDSVKQSDAYNEVKKIVDKYIEFYKKHAPLITGYLKANMLSITYPGAYAAIKATSSSTQFLIMGALIGGIALSQMFAYHDAEKFTMKRAYTDILGITKEERQTAENDARQAFEIYGKTKKYTDDEINSKFNTVLNSINIAINFSDLLDKTIFDNDRFKTYTNFKKPIAIPTRIIDIINTIPIGGKQYPIFSDSQISFIKSETNIIYRNTAIRNMHKIKNEILATILKDFLNPNNTGTIIDSILSNTNYIQKKYGLENNFSKVLNYNGNKFDTEKNIKRFNEYSLEYNENNGQPQIKNRQQPKQIKITDPTKFIKTLPTIKLPNLEDISTGNKIMRHQAIASSLVKANQAFVETKGIFQINTQRLASLGNFGLKPIKEIKQYGNIMHDWSSDAEEFLLETFGIKGRYIDDNGYEQDRYYNVKNPTISYLMNKIINHYPELKNEFNKCKKTQTIESVNEFIKFINSKEYIRKYLVDECGFTGGVLNLSDFLTTTENADSAYNKLFNLCDLLTLGKPNTLLSKMGLNKEKFKKLHEFYNQRNVIPDELIDASFSDMLKQVQILSYDDRNTDDIIRKLIDISEQFDILLQPKNETTKDKLNSQQSLLVAYTEFNKLLSTYKSILIQIRIKHNEELIKEKRNKSKASNRQSETRYIMR